MSIIGDFTTPAVQAAVRSQLPRAQCDGVFSDMSHNLMGHASTDVLKQLALVTDALSFAVATLSLNGVFVAKFRQGGKEADVLAACKRVGVASWLRCCEGRVGEGGGGGGVGGG